MYFKFLLFTGLLGSTFANPIPVEESTNSTTVEPRDKVPLLSVCARDEPIAHANWYLYAPKDAITLSDRDCGHKYLDKARGRCGAVTDWKCQWLDKDGNRKSKDKDDEKDDIVGARMYLHTSIFCTADDMLAAMGAASADGEKPDECEEPPKWMLPPGRG